MTGIIKAHFKRNISVLAIPLSLANMQMYCAIARRKSLYSFQQQPMKLRLKELNNSGFSLHEVQDRQPLQHAPADTLLKQCTLPRKLFLNILSVYGQGEWDRGETPTNSWGIVPNIHEEHSVSLELMITNLPDIIVETEVKKLTDKSQHHGDLNEKNL